MISAICFVLEAEAGGHYLKNFILSVKNQGFFKTGVCGPKRLFFFLHSQRLKKKIFKLNPSVAKHSFNHAPMF